MTQQLCYTLSPPMSPLKNHWRKRELRGRSLLLATVCLIAAACSTTPPVAKVLFEDPRGTVFLQQIPDRSFQASHPINLEPALIARLLSGVLIQERRRALQAILSGSPSPIPVFSAEEVQFLAPLLAKALATAAPDQVAGFLLTSPRPGASLLEYAATETTAGSLYAHDLSLGFSLSQYRYAPTRTSTENIAHRRLPDSSGLSDRVLLFNPTQAQRSDSIPRPPVGMSGEQFLAIDYRILQQSSPSAATPQPIAAPPNRKTEPIRQDPSATPPSEIPAHATRTLEQRDEEIHALKDLVIKKDLELETIKKELQSLRQELHDRPARQESQKPKTKPPSKPQPATP